MVRSKRRAFTLIELLVVISIIALLLSILMPGLQKAKQHALRMLCRTNLHSYGIATNMYLLEYDENFMDPWKSIYKEEKFPGEQERYCRWHNPDYNLASYANGPDQEPGTDDDYAGPLWSYLEEEDINLCPVFAKLGVQFGELHNPGSCIGAPFDPQFGYSQNVYLGTADLDWIEGGVAKASELKSPASTFFFAEENPWPMTPGRKDYTGLDYQGPRIAQAVLNDNALLTRFTKNDTSAANDAFGTFHSPPSGNYNFGTSNAVMMDGSIKEVSPYNDGTFRLAYPGLGVKYRPDDAPEGAKLP